MYDLSDILLVHSESRSRVIEAYFLFSLFLKARDRFVSLDFVDFSVIDVIDHIHNGLMVHFDVTIAQVANL